MIGGTRVVGVVVVFGPTVMGVRSGRPAGLGTVARGAGAGAAAGAVAVVAFFTGAFGTVADGAAD
jgi:hypothetical protein